MIITALSKDGIAFAVNVHPTNPNIAHERTYIKDRFAATLDQNPDFVRVDAIELPAAAAIIEEEILAEELPEHDAMEIM